MPPAWAASPSTTERSVEVCACSPELQAQTSTERSVVDGEAAQAGDILIRYAHIESPANPAHSQGGTPAPYRPGCERDRPEHFAGRRYGGGLDNRTGDD